MSPTSSRLEILGVSLLAGWKTRWGAAALVVFLVPVTLVFHNFWAAQGTELQLQMIGVAQFYGAALRP